MSGIVGSKFNIRGSGLVASYGTDGQHMLSAGAGVSNVFETVAGGGSVLQIKQAFYSDLDTFDVSSYTLIDANCAVTITPTAADSSFRLQCNIFNGVSNHDNACNFNWFDSQVGTAAANILFADSTVSSGSRAQRFQMGGWTTQAASTVDDYRLDQTSMDLLYTPASNNGDARTFSICGINQNGNATNILMNHSQNTNGAITVSSLTVTEIANGIYT